MKLNPRQAPLYGSCVLTVQLSDEELCQGEEGREDAELFLVFAGSTQRHLSSTLRVSHDTLQAVCPAHECCESVVVTTCSADPGGLVHELASERMCFVQDLAFDMAQFLVGAVGRADMLEDALLLDEHQIPLQECERMDQNLALALSHLTLPAGWSLLGNCNAPEPQETLLHFAARRGLQRVARFLLRQPGAREALALPNKQGVTPASLAQSRGHSALLELLTQEETSTQDSTETHRRIPCSAGVVQHHPCLNTYTLSVGTQPGTVPRSLQADLQDFRCLIHHNAHGKGGAVLQLQSESPHAVGECADNPETRQACFEQPQHDSLDTREQESTSLCVKGNKNEHGGCCPGPLQHGCPAPPSDNSNSDEKRVCACENTEGDYGVQAESAAACVEGSRKEGDSGDCLQSTFGGESAAHQTSSCGKEGEETDRAQDLICEAQGTAEGPEREVQAEDCNSGRPDQDQHLEEDLSEHKAGAAGDMGITQSLDTPESSDVESGSQGAESDDEKEVENTDISSSELEEKAEGLVDLNPGVDQPLNTSREKDGHDSNETDLNSALHSLEDRREFNGSQVSCEQTSYELESDEQEKPGKDNIEGQEEDPVILCSNTEREISQEQAEATCHHGDTSEGTPEGQCLENETLEKIQSPLEAETNEGEGMCNSSGASTVTLNAVSNDSHLPEQETETGREESRSTGEPDPAEVSRAAAGSESEAQKLGSSGDVSQPEFDSEPESHTPTSEDTLEPEEGCTTKGVSCSDQQGSPEPETPKDTLESQVLAVASEDTENKRSLGSNDCFEGRTEEITLQSGDVVDLCPLENRESVSEQGTASQNSGVDQSEEHLSDTRHTENSQTPENNERVPEQGDGTISQNSAVDQSEEERLSDITNESSQTLESKERVPEQEDGTVSQNSEADQLEDQVDTRISENGRTLENNKGVPEQEDRNVSQNSEAAQSEDKVHPKTTENSQTPESKERVPNQEDGTFSQNSVVDQSEKQVDAITSKNSQTPESKERVPEQGDGTVSQNSVVEQSEEEVDTRNSENSQTPESKERVPEQEDGSVSQNPVVDQSEEREELGDTTHTENSQTIIEEEQLCLDHSVGGVSSTSNVTDTVGISVSLEERSNVELGSELSSKPAVVDTGSADIELTEAQEMQETEAERCEDAHASALQKEKDIPLEDQVDCQTLTCPDVNTDNAVSKIHRERDSLCLDSSQASTHSRALEKRHSSESTESPRSQARHSTGSTTLRDSGSDTDGFISTDTGEDNVFRKAEETLGPGDSTSEASVSCSSTDDTASLGHPSSSAESSEEVRRGGGGGGAGVGAGGETEEEAKDRLTEVPLRSSLLRTTVRSLSPFRRHSWGPGKNQGGETDMNQRSSVRSTGVQKPVFHRRSYSLEGLAAERDDGKGWQPQGGGPSQGQRGVHRQQSEDRGSQVSLTEEGLESDLGDHSSLDSQKSKKYRPLRHNCPSMTLPLRQSVSMLSISQRDIDGMRSFSSTSSSLGYSITEEEPGPLRGDFEGKSGTKMSRTFSYLKSKMYKKTREKDKEKNREKDRETKEKEKKAVNGHLFSSATSVHTALCQHCNKALNAKDAVSCTSCSVCVHKSCRDNIPACTKGKFQKQQFLMPESTTMPGVTLRAKTSAPRERPWSAVLSPDDHSLVITPRRHTSIMPFNSSNLSKSMSISNIAVFDEMPIKGLRYLSQSTDSLHKANKVNESTESLIDEGTEMIDGQLMGEFEADAKELEADSWSFTMDKKYLKQLKKDVIKRQDVIYELIQTEMHHVRTLRIMADVYGKGLLKEVQLEPQTVEKVFPMLDDLLELHTVFFSSLLERKKEAKQENTDGGFVIKRIGDILVNQFSGSRAESMKKVYGKFCSRHNEAVNFYKELHAKDKRFQAFIKKKMSSSIVRRLGIPECILLVTQRITKYPVLMQRILQHTKENEEDYEDLSQALQLVKEVIAAVDSKVNEHEKKRRLKEIYSRTDGKSIMRMKSGQMFAREDLIRGRKLLHDGPLQLKSTAGRLKDVQAVLLSDVLVFLQEKDQKYVFASLDQRATVISLQKLIVREVANEDRGLFLITAGIERPEMVEVHASSREERNTWMQLIQDAMHSIEKDDDEGIPSETEEDKKLLESKAKEMRDMLRRKDDQILALLQEKMKLFHDMCECTSSDEKMLFRACNDDMPRGEPIMKEAIKEVEMLQTLVNSSLGGAVGQQVVSAPGSTVSVCLPRRAETFGGFDSHQMNISKHGDKEEGEDLRRTESDSVLKKGGNTNLLLLLKRNSEQVLSSVTHLHDLLNSLQAVVVQQDTFIEDQRQVLTERPSSRPSSRPPSLVEQEKQRSLERHRQEAAALQRQQAAHAEERKRREKEWDAREKELMDRESILNSKEDEVQRRRRELEEARRELQGRKEDYQKDLERLRDSQRKLEREKEQMQREMEKLEYLRETEKRVNRTPSSTSEDSLNIQSSSSVERDLGEAELSASPRKNSLSRMDSKHKGRNLNPFSLGPKAVSTDGHKQVQSRLLQLAKAKDKKDKKKKKSKSKPSQEAESHLLPLTEPPLDGEIFFC
ncbi:A-kinase anchor protein 13 isoform X3 [Colossoma macropomum]|uniref:A-kinase anchor protein 13 isoform X3 n=1 Tax=Colossoma macropomum TaxID=42526 RepID=UPI001864B71F|nr:A-kinase anchor protein 13 isoform X3 [Colossoma macropomum]